MSPRFRTPVATGIVIAVIAEIYAIFFVYGPGIYSIAGGLGVIVSALFLGIASLSAIVLPFRKSLFRAAPAIVQKKIGPVPILLILGLASFLSMMSLLLFGQIIPAVQGGLNPDQAAVTFGLFIWGLPFYYLVKWYRRKVNNIDLSQAYREIPPE